MELVDVCAEFVFDEAAPGGPVQFAVVSGRRRICGGVGGKKEGGLVVSVFSSSVLLPIRSQAPFVFPPPFLPSN